MRLYGHTLIITEQSQFCEQSSLLLFVNTDSADLWPFTLTVCGLTISKVEGFTLLN